MQSQIFSIIITVFSVTWSFRNHSNVLIYCLRNIPYYFFKNWSIVFRILWWVQKNSICLKYKYFVTFINVFTVTFDQWNVSLLNKSVLLQTFKCVDKSDNQRQQFWRSKQINDLRCYKMTVRVWTVCPLHWLWQQNRFICSVNKDYMFI